MVNDKKNIAEKKRGNTFGFFFFKMLIRVLGIRSAYSFLYIVCLYYLLLDRTSVKRAMPYIKRRFKNASKFMLYFHVYKLFISQGKQLIDQSVYASNSNFFQFNLKQNINIKKVVKEAKTGLIFLTSHIGNWQIGCSVLSRLNIKEFNILIKPEENKSLDAILNFNLSKDRSPERVKINTISTNGDFGGILDVVNVLQKGGIVTMMGDRSYGSKTVPLKFLGDNANFPISAFRIASTVNSPIVLLYVIKESIKNYTIYVNNILYPNSDLSIQKTIDFSKKYVSELNSKQSVKQIKINTLGYKKENRNALLNEYVKELESFADKYPYQCFIFNDIWKK